MSVVDKFITMKTKNSWTRSDLIVHCPSFSMTEFVTLHGGIQATRKKNGQCCFQDWVGFTYQILCVSDNKSGTHHETWNMWSSFFSAIQMPMWRLGNFSYIHTSGDRCQRASYLRIMFIINVYLFVYERVAASYVVTYEFVTIR